MGIEFFGGTLAGRTWDGEWSDLVRETFTARFDDRPHEDYEEVEDMEAADGRRAFFHVEP